MNPDKRSFNMSLTIYNLVEESGYILKRKSSTHGGEFCAACPFCKEGKDRFLLWPNKLNKDGTYQGGRFSCRVCGKYGDAITFLREFRGLSYKEACEVLRLKPRQRDPSFVQQPALKLPVALEPPQCWQEKALGFANWAHQQLLSNPSALELVQKRGFTYEAIDRFRLGYNPGDDEGRDFYRERESWGLKPELRQDGKPKKLWLPMGITVPSFSEDGRVIKVKIRRSSWKEGDELPKYVELSGSKRCPSIYGDRRLLSALVLESELDGLLIQQFAADIVFSVALGGASRPLDYDTDQLVKNTPTVIFTPDFDDAGIHAWVKWKRMYPHVKRLLTPLEKSAGDAFLAGINLREWLLDAIPKKI